MIIVEMEVEEEKKKLMRRRGEVAELNEGGHVMVGKRNCSVGS